MQATRLNSTSSWTCTVDSLEDHEDLRHYRWLFLVYKSAPEVHLSCRRKSQNGNSYFQSVDIWSRSSDCTDSFLLNPDKHDFSRSHHTTSFGPTSGTITIDSLKPNFTVADGTISKVTMHQKVVICRWDRRALQGNWI